MHNYLLLWAGSAVSLVGDNFQVVALAALVLDLAGKTSGLGAVLMVQAIPRALLMVAGGVVTDRLRPRPVMVASDLLRAALVAGLVALAVTGRIELWHLYAYAAAFGTVSAFFWPASASIVPELLPPDQIRSANALSFVTTNLVGFIAPLLAGAAIHRAGSALGFAVNSASFVFSAAAVWMIRANSPHARPQGSVLQQLREGLAAARADPVVFSVITLASVYFFGFAGSTYVGLPALAKLALRGGNGGVGLVLGAAGAGALAGALVIGSLPEMRRRGLVAAASIVAAGSLLAAAGLAPSVATAMPLLALSGAGGSVAAVVFTTVVQTRTPPHVRGRVMSLLLLGVYGIYPISYGLAGVAGDALGPRGLVAAGGVIVAVAGLIGMTRRPLRALD